MKQTARKEKKTSNYQVPIVDSCVGLAPEWYNSVMARRKSIEDWRQKNTLVSLEKYSFQIGGSPLDVNFTYYTKKDYPEQLFVEVGFFHPFDETYDYPVIDFSPETAEEALRGIEYVIKQAATERDQDIVFITYERDFASREFLLRHEYSIQDSELLRAPMTKVITKD